MKPVTGKKFAKVLAENGWQLLRVQGSHHIFGKAGTNVRLSVPIHKNQNLKIGLQTHLMKSAGLNESDF